MANTITHEQAQRALEGQIKRETGHLVDLVSFGTWTVVAEYAESIAKAARGIVALSKTPENFGQQEMRDLLVPPPAVDRQLKIFGGGALARPSVERAASR